MMYVGVKHKPQHNNLFWFYVPKALEKDMILGCDVQCNTRKGIQTGVVMAIKDGITEQEAMILSNGVGIKPITSIKKDIDMRSIIIPVSFANSIPREQKVLDKLNYFCAHGSFRQTVSINKNNVLYDGYATYLAAKRMGRRTITAYKSA